MATLIFSTKDRSEIPAVLTSVTGFTIRIVNLSIPSDVSPTDVWGQLADLMSRSNARQISRKGNHALYEMNHADLNQTSVSPKYQLMWIVQVQPPPKAGKKNQQTWIEESMLIHRAAREWIAVAEGSIHFTVDGKPVNLFKILQDGMQIQLHDLKVSFQDIEEIVVTVDTLERFRKGRPCPFCQGTFTVGEVMIQCPSCGTPHHADCWKENGGRCSGPVGCRCGVRISLTESKS